MPIPIIAGVVGLGSMIGSAVGGVANAAGNAVGDLIQVLFALSKIMLRASLFLAAITAFIVVLNLAISGFGIALNQSVLNDLFAMIQMWLPFNLNSLLIWITTSVIAYLTYRIVLAGVIWIHRVLG